MGLMLSKKQFTQQYKLFHSLITHVFQNLTVSFFQYFFQLVYIPMSIFNKKKYNDCFKT